MTAPIPTRLVPSATVADLPPARVEREFRDLLANGLTLRVAGSAKKRPARLLDQGYAPRFKLELFDTIFYLAPMRQNEDIRFFVAYLVQSAPTGRRKIAFARLFYKDAALVWRSASHVTDEWIGKGDLRGVIEDGEEAFYSAESTTDLPLEMQTALETLCRGTKDIPHDEKAPFLVLRRAPLDRVEAYRDFTAPRRRAQANPRNLIHGGKQIAYFKRHGDPTSLRFVAGYEPDLDAGVIEESATTSKLYGGEVREFRVLSRNRKIQYLIMAAPRQVWIIPPQTLTTELTSYGVRSVDVNADDDLFVPGYEYHLYLPDTDPPELMSQIPRGYVGEQSTVDTGRADASPWLDALPIVQEFRAKVLARKARRSGAATPTRRRRRRRSAPAAAT